MFLTAYSQHLISTVFTQLLTSTFKDAWYLQFHSHSGDLQCRSHWPRAGQWASIPLRFSRVCCASSSSMDHMWLHVTESHPMAQTAFWFSYRNEAIRGYDSSLLRLARSSQVTPILRAVSWPQIAPPPQPHVHIPSQEKERKVTK